MERLQAALSVTWYVDFTFKISYGFMEQAQACKESTTVLAQILMKFINVQDGHVQISSTSFIQIGQKMWTARIGINLFL
jgi:hypothetical protein